MPMAQAALNNLDAAGIERPKGADGTDADSEHGGYRLLQRKSGPRAESRHRTAYRRWSPKAP